MGLGGFASYFELFVVFNFVYFGAEKFRFTLTETIFRGERHLKGILNASDSIYKLLIPDGDTTDTLDLFTDKKTDEVVEELRQSKSWFELEKNKLFSRFDRRCIIKSFANYCLLAALFSLSILLIIGILPSVYQEKLIYDYLFISSVLILVCLVAAICNDSFNKLNIPISTPYVLGFFFIVLVSGTLGVCYKFTFISGTVYYDTRVLGIALSVVAVSSHFIIYLCIYFWVYRSERRKAYKLNKRVKEKVNKIDPSLISNSELIDMIRKTKVVVSSFPKKSSEEE